MTAGGAPPVTGASAWFPADPASVADVRQFVVASLDGAYPALQDTVLLVASELATNALRYGGTGPYLVGVEEVARGVRVTVTDDGSGHPALLDPATTDLTGRGLRIVDAFSDSWGVSRFAGTSGKAVWSEVCLPG